MYVRVNDLSLCEKCAEKLERDLIRQRDWDYTVSAFCLPEEDRERLRLKIISQYGSEYELIEPPKRKKHKKKHKAKDKKKNKS